MPAPVEIVPYDPSWPSTFAELKAELAAALGIVALDILHVGSTAVPGLAAKPTIDIDVVIESESVLALAIGRLAKIDYAFEGDLGIPGRHAFRSPPKYPTHHHHLYVCAKDNRELQRHLAFRDYLRSHPEALKAYAELKLDAARAHRNDRDAYASAKSEWVENILKLA